MATRDITTTIPRSQTTGAFPQPTLSEAGDGASILSSQITDIASEDGREYPADPAGRTAAHRSRRSVQTTASRPNTGISSQRGAWPQSPPTRRGYVSHSGAQRGSISGSTASRPLSATTRSHVPSLTSYAFFRPMSSQRLQAQRGARPPLPGPQGQGEDGTLDGGNRQSVNSIQTARHAMSPTEDLDRPPPSRGTEMTEQETAERRTVNTSPTQGHHATGSLSESVRPLQRNPVNTKGLSLNIDKSYKNGNTLATPSKSPRSFRSSFLLPARGDPTPDNSNRSNQGREKLASVASSPGLTPMDKAKQLPSEKLGKNFEYFTGNTVFFWGGRLQNTRDKPISIATGSLVVIPTILFFVFSAPWLWQNISPAIPIVFAYLFYICISSFIHASVTDPGILPRNLHPFPPADENEDPLRLAPPMNDWTMIKSAQSATAAMEVPTKYCKTCNIWRPARGHHCRICDNCIETQDHHCVWLNNCVGRRNYRYFFTFVTGCTLMALYLLGASLAQILVYRSRQNITFGAAIDHFRVPFAMVIYGFLTFPYPAALMGYHLFLMGRGETTREYLNSHKFLKKDRHRPFTQGNIIKNWLVVLCRPRPPTYLRFKHKYEEGDQRFGERKGKRITPVAEEIQGGTGLALEMQSVPSGERGFQSPSALRGTSGP